MTWHKQQVLEDVLLNISLAHTYSPMFMVKKDTIAQCISCTESAGCVGTMQRAAAGLISLIIDGVQSQCLGPMLFGTHGRVAGLAEGMSYCTKWMH